ncbi:hypothetical protein SLA2020_087630 [Shorea laevis]
MATSCHGEPPLTFRPSYGIRYVDGFGRCMRTISAARSAMKRAATVAVVVTVLDFRVASGDAPFVDDELDDSIGAEN